MKQTMKNKPLILACASLGFAVMFLCPVVMILALMSFAPLFAAFFFISLGFAAAAAACGVWALTVKRDVWSWLVTVAGFTLLAAETLMWLAANSM
ncbi:MAG: hypothetical protein LBV47_00815 [Bacteroidales bacterium]|jgi:hypothetical protein|nr:hypothetical protein [Bacteroidales bacterium]